ncbi:helix-turn-helix transcriptional regulator [Thioclava kandeliae]|uniref:LuxR C-terminal-related transcriptional regulator n=1 Tax=Thioclava kandeliae TaxID=3070818 RepID=A0ABV1SE22_9RHOB
MGVSDLTSTEINSYAAVIATLAQARSREEVRRNILGDLRVVMRADTVSSCSWDDTEARFGKLVYEGGNPEIEALYLSTFQYDDPITFRMRQTARPVILDEVIDRTELRRTAFYQDLLKRDKLEWGLNLFAFGADGHDLGDLRFWRRSTRENFASRETMLLAGLAPHFKAALERLPAEPPPALSPRETEICQLLGQGLTDREIAAHLQIGFATVRTHISNAMHKHGARNKTALAVRTACLTE